jgi:hypothetical protein
LVERNDFSQKAFLSINLNASDSLIKKDFNAWLTAVRAYRHWPRLLNMTPDELVRKWAGYKLIACIDLLKVIGPAKGQKIIRKNAVRWAGVHPARGNDNFASYTLPKAMADALKPKVAEYLGTSQL